MMPILKRETALKPSILLCSCYIRFRSYGAALLIRFPLLLKVCLFRGWGDFSIIGIRIHPYLFSQ